MGIGVFFIIVVIGILIIGLGMVSEVYNNYSEEKDAIKHSVENDYKKLIRCCRIEQNVLGWLATINSRIESFMESDEYKVRKPYDKFKLTIPSKRYAWLVTFIVIDKNLTPKFVVNFEPSEHDGGRSEEYLKHSLSYGKEIDDFVKKCQNTIMNEKLEKKRIKTIENIINK